MRGSRARHRGSLRHRAAICGLVLVWAQPLGAQTPREESLFFGLRLDASTEGRPGVGLSGEWLSQGDRTALTFGASAFSSEGTRWVLAKGTGAWRPASGWWLEAALEGGPGRADVAFFFRKARAAASYELRPGRLFVKLAATGFAAGAVSSVIAQPSATIRLGAALLEASYGRSLHGSYRAHYGSLRIEALLGAHRAFATWTLGRSGVELLRDGTFDEAVASSIQEVGAGVTFPGGRSSVTVAATASFQDDLNRFTVLAVMRVPIR